MTGMRFYIIIIITITVMENTILWMIKYLNSRYIEAFNRERSMFGDNEAKWQSILDQPEKFDIFESFTKKPWSINPQDVPSRDLYKQFFKVNKPKRFQPLSSHCSFIWGCQADKIKETISSTLPKLLVKFQMLADDRACDGEGYEDDEF